MTEIAKEILPVNLEDEMRQSYLDYAWPQAGASAGAVYHERTEQ